MKKFLILVGVLQAAGVALYAVFIGNIMMSNTFPTIPPVMLFIFSASVFLCGSLVFGYPFFLILQKRIRDAAVVFVTTNISMIVFVGAGLTWAIAFGTKVRM